MSVLIKDIQMPKNCSECPVALSGKYCRINQTYTTYVKLPIRPDHCPLAEFPDHHGRLIDADELKKAFDIVPAGRVTRASVKTTINHAATIVEAEEVEE